MNNNNNLKKKNKTNFSLLNIVKKICNKISQSLNTVKKEAIPLDIKLPENPYTDENQLENFLIKNGFDKNNILHRNSEGHTPLTLALINKNYDLVDLILKQDKRGIIANYNYLEKADDGLLTPKSPLFIALKNGSSDLLLKLLQYGADFNELMGPEQKTIYQYLNEAGGVLLQKDEKFYQVKKFLMSKGAHNNTDQYYVPHAPVETLVIEGGGARGAVYPGALKALEERGIPDGLKRVGGVSAGSILALLISLGYSAEDMNKFMNEVDYKKFMRPAKTGIINKIGSKILDISSKIFPKIEVLKHILPGIFSNRKGTYRTQEMREWFDDKISNILGKKNATFKDLQEAKKNNPKIKDLYVELCNLTTRKGEVWSHETHPDAIIADVITTSCSFPLAFEVTNLKYKDQIYSYADGGIYDNCPVLSMFNSSNYLPKGYNFDDKGANPGVYILKVDNKEECELLLWNQTKGRKSEKYGKFDYIKDLLRSFGSKQQLVAEMHPTRIVQIYDNGINTLSFNLTKKQKELAVKTGYDSCKNHLELYRGLGTFYFMYDPKNKDKNDKRFFNLVDRPEFKSFTSISELEQEEQKLLKKIKILQNYNKDFIKGRSVVALKKYYYKRLSDIRYLKNKYINNNYDNNNENINRRENKSKDIVGM